MNRMISLWDPGVAFPDISKIRYLDLITHVTVHRAREGEYQFLHGAAIVAHKNVLYAAWANSLIDENSESEILRGRRSYDQGITWSDIEVIGQPLPGEDCRSHCSFLSHDDKLWAFGARFGKIRQGSVFPGLKTEAYILDSTNCSWQTVGPVANDAWPYDEPKRMPNGNWIMGAQDSEAQAAVLISHGDDFLHWDTVKIPIQDRIKLMFAETTIIIRKMTIVAIIRNSDQPFALVSVSLDCGKSWTTAETSNFPMANSKAYAGLLSTGQYFAVSNTGSRDTLTVAVSSPGQDQLSHIWKIRQGVTPQPFYKGWAKSAQWSYPYAIEYDGRLFIVYSVGKEDCELSIIPIRALADFD